MSDLDRKIIRSTAWVGVSFGGSQVIGFGLLIVLAHLLTPAEFGLVSLASILVVIVTYLQESGLGMAVIRQRDDLERAIGTMWVFMVAMSVVLYGVTFGIAPLLADVFSQSGLTNVVRVLGLLLVIRALGSTAGALIERDLAFRSKAKAELGGAAVQAAVAIPLAFAGFGVWSLVAGQLASQCLTTAVLVALAPVHPNPRLASWSMLRSLGRYGRHVTIGNILVLANTNVDNVVIGRFLGTAALGYYAMAWRIANLPAQGLSYIVGRVMFPAYATIQDDASAFRRAFVMNVQRVALVSLPVSLGILICADPIIVGLFGERWHPAVAPLRILGVFGLIRSFSGASGAVFQAAGRPQLVYQTGFLYAAVLAGALAALAPPFGINGVAGAMTIAVFVAFIPAWGFALRILDLRLRDLLSELRSAGVCSLVLAGALGVTAVVVRSFDSVLQLVVLVVCGFVVYGIVLMTLGRSELRSITAAFRPEGGSSS